MTSWIFSRRQDLIWIQGSVLSGLVLMAAFLFLPKLDQTNYAATHPALWLLLFWGVVFDGSHVMATYARSYLAPDLASKAGLPSAWVWTWLLLGPALAVVDQFFFVQHRSIVGQAGTLFGFFLAFAYLWAYYHLVRQHYGFLALYRRRAGQKSSLTAPDALLLWLGCAYPFLRYNLSDAYRTSGLPVLLPEAWLSPMRMLLDSAVAVVALVVLWRCKRSEESLGPKHAFLVIVIGFSNLTFALLDNLLVITAVLTVFHNLQYHRIVWQYESGHQRLPLGSIWRYVWACLGFGLVWYLPRFLGVAWAAGGLWGNILIGLGWGVAFHHYSVDARIWRVRSQPDVGQALDRK